jgi:F-type H+-transporting ATPase subunit alpha
MEEQVVVLFGGINGFIDDYPLSSIRRWERELIEFMHSRKQDVLDAIRVSGKLDEANEQAIRGALTEFAKSFSVDEEVAA